MKKKLLFIADSLKKVNLKSDSSLALAQVALEENWQVFWCEAENLHFINDELVVNYLSEIISLSINDLKYEAVNDNSIPLANFNYCFIRKDPPFDENYKDLCWLLATQSKVKILNPPEMLLAYHEKSLQWKVYSAGAIKKENLIATCLSSDKNLIKNYLEFNHELFVNGIVCKPWLGHGGEDVQLFKNIEELFVFFQQCLSKNASLPKYLIQPYLQEIHTAGDRRVLIANGEIIGDFVRLPAQGKIASNLAQGGTAVIREMTNEQVQICANVANYLKCNNIMFAGLDLIGTKIGEINITSPTGLRTYENLTGNNIARKAFELMVNSK